MEFGNKSMLAGLALTLPEEKMGLVRTTDKQARELAGSGVAGLLDPGLIPMYEDPSWANAGMLALGMTGPIGKGIGKGIKQWKKFRMEGKPWYDNPGGEWLENSRRRADSRYDPKDDPTPGDVTAGYVARMSPGELASLPGQMGEHLYKPGAKYDNVYKSIKENGYLEEIDGIPNRPLIMVNHKGEAYISEGNNRIRAAADLGVKDIPVEVRFKSGGEAADGPFAIKRVYGAGDEGATVSSITPKVAAANVAARQEKATKYVDRFEEGRKNINITMSKMDLAAEELNARGIPGDLIEAARLGDPEALAAIPHILEDAARTRAWEQRKTPAKLLTELQEHAQVFEEGVREYLDADSSFTALLEDSLANADPDVWPEVLHMIEKKAETSPFYTYLLSRIQHGDFEP